MKNCTLKRTMALVAVILTTVGVKAADFVVDGISYNITDKNGKIVAVVAGSTKYTGNVTIPGTVTNNGTTYTVKAIGSYAFQNCKDLTSVSIENSIENINNRAFQGCNNLSEFTWTNSIRSIEDYAFDGCTRLANVTLSSALRSIGAGAFENCSGMTKLTINEGCTVIAGFVNCTKLTSLNIPNSVTSIGSSAFSGCKALTSATIGDGLKTIPAYCFQNCTSLESVHIGQKVENINNRAFQNCNSLSDVNWTDNIRYMGDYAFNACTRLTNVTLSAALESMDGGVFENCTGITTLTIHDGCAVIAGSSFSGCTKLTSVSIPNSVTSMGGSAFAGCKALTSATIGDGMKAVPSYCFQNCTQLSTLKLGKKVSALNNRCLQYCPNIKTITIYNNETPSVGEYVFDNYNATLYVPEAALSDYKAHATWKKFAQILPIVENLYLIIAQSESGRVMMPVTKGMNYAVVIEAEEGWKVNSVTYNGTDVTEQLENGVFTTPAMYESGELRVAYESATDAISARTVSNVRVYGQSGNIVVRNVEAGDIVNVYTTDGKLVSTTPANGSELQIGVNSGAVYIVKAGNKTLKIAM